VKPLVLASSSPRRAELLRAAGVPFVVRSVPVDEAMRADERPHDYVRRLALAKASAVQAAPDELVLGADTVVVAAAGVCLGKPADAAEAAAMLRQLAGRTHEVVTGIAFVFGGAELAVDTATTKVAFAPMSEAEIAWYVATDEPYDKAGGYAVQGLASRFVTTIDGSYSNVVGLPVHLVCRLVTRSGGDLLRTG
jgi:septum formation protein